MMITIKEKVSYLKGLAEGMKITEATNEGKLLLAILDVLEDISEDLGYYEDEQDDFEERLDKIEEDINYLEDEVYGDYDCDCDYDHDHECDCGCGCEDCDCDHDDIQYITIECPHCKKETSFDVDMFDKDTDSVECPYCHEEIEVTCEDLNEDEE